MIPDLIVSLPRDVPLPQFRLFQRVRFCREFLDEDETALGLVVGWGFITREAIRLDRVSSRCDRKLDHPRRRIN